MHMQRRQRQIMVVVEVVDQAAGEITRGVIVDINQRGDAFADAVSALGEGRQ